jgi:succinate dehydrogenase / fumarate reductase cytochrome b subunit
MLLSVLLMWSLSHHLLAGIRHLLLDVEIGLEKSSARASAWLVNLGAILATAWYAVNLL